jgi:hypothetical protein
MLRPRVKSGLKLLAFAVGLVLAAAAVRSALLHVDLGRLRQAPPGLLIGSAVMTLANLFLTGAIFCVVTWTFDARPPVTWRDNWDLACASTLLNYLPVRPGLAGRTAYLRLRHGLPIHQALIIAGIVFALFLVAAAGAAVVILGVDGPWQAPAAAAALVLLSLGTGPLGQKMLHRRVRAAWAWLPLRTADLLTVAARLWLAFRIVGCPIGVRQAVVLGAVDMIVSVAALMPNGLGVSEWATGGAARLIGAAATPQIGQAAKLIDRSISIVVLLPVALWSLHRLRRAAGPHGSAGATGTA